MIGVIADDFTGAAELGAIGLNHGLVSEVQTGSPSPTDAQLVAVSTDTRSQEPQAAAAIVERVALRLQKMGAEWIFKKVDSVLRGPVLAELIALQGALHKSRVLLVSANPSLGRTIRDGCYLIGETPLHLTAFAQDPDHPARTSDLKHLLGAVGNARVRVADLQDELPAEGVVVGNAETQIDLAAGAERLDNDTLAAGAADFFAQALRTRGHGQRSEMTVLPTTSPTRMLFVCGSAPAHARRTIVQAVKHGVTVMPVPPALLLDESPPAPLLEEWIQEIAALVRDQGRAAVTMSDPPPIVTDSRSLARRVANPVAQLVRQRQMDCICIEGGETASEVVAAAGWNRFAVIGEVARGVVWMRIEARAKPWLIVKPGSYEWPEQLWVSNRHVARRSAEARHHYET